MLCVAGAVPEVAGAQAPRHQLARPLQQPPPLDVHAVLLQAARDYDADVKAGTFPGPEHTF